MSRFPATPQPRPDRAPARRLFAAFAAQAAAATLVGAVWIGMLADPGPVAARAEPVALVTRSSHRGSSGSPAPGARPSPSAARPASVTPATSRPPEPPPAPPPTPEAAAVPAPLTLRSIVASVRDQAASVKPCLRTALHRGEIERGQPYLLRLSWKILPDGRVTAARVAGPPDLLDSSLAGCVASRMQRWRFAPSAAGAPVTHYPFGPFTIQ